METILYNQWSILYEDSKIEVRKDPRCPEEYALGIKETEKILLLNRRSMRDIVVVNRIEGNRIIERLIPRIERDFLAKTGLSFDSLNLAITKTYLREEEKYNR